ncbi:MAG: hypothetical protein AAFZ18_13370 [Myxococcota bacterium]
MKHPQAPAQTLLETIGSVSTTSIERTLKHIVPLGARVLVRRTVLPDGTAFGVFADLKGRPVRMVETGVEPPGAKPINEV